MSEVVCVQFVLVLVWGVVRGVVQGVVWGVVWGAVERQRECNRSLARLRLAGQIELIELLWAPSSLF